MDPALAPGTPPKAVVFQDGLGERRRISDVSGADTIEQLCLRGELTAIPSFEFALRERASRLANFRHVYYGRVRSVDRLTDPASTLAIVSDSIKGVRLANLLAASERRPMTLDISASVHLIRQLVAAVAMLHENARDVAHGAIGPERIIVTPNARIVIVEYVLGAALEQLHYSQERYWKELRIALPSSTGLPRFDHRADVTQIGLVALSMILGRLLHEDEYPSRVGDVLAGAWAISSKGELEPLPPRLRQWIGRALQLEPHHSFSTALEARDELDRVLSGDDEEDEDEESTTVTASAPAVPSMTVEPRPAFEAPIAPVIAPPPAVEPPAAKAEKRSFLRPDPPAPTAEPSSSGWVTISRPLGKSEDSGVSFRKDDRSKKDEPAFLKRDEPSFLKREEPSFANKEGSGFFKKADSALKKDDAVPAPTVSKLDAGNTSWKSPFTMPLPAATTYAPFEHQDDHHPDEAAAETPAAARPMGKIAAAAVALIVISAGGVYAGRKLLAPGAGASANGTLSMNSNPPGAQVVVDGQMSGVTPLSLALKAGPHNVELRGSGDPRQIPVTITAGKELSQYIELPKVTAFGQLQVRTDPAGANVTVDGIPRGKSPILVESLAAGEHSVVLETEGATTPVKQTVAVEAGMTASLVVPMAVGEAVPASGWIAVSAPVELQIFEGKRLVGTSQSDRLMMATGRHDIEVVNETLGYRQTRTVQVAAGKTAALKLEWPKGSIAINALPWAEVWIDGERIGETPIGNLSLPIGPHEILFRHPDLGEQRYATTVSLKAPVRVSVDLRKK
jgi:serine/threonine protein kinase